VPAKHRPPPLLRFAERVSAWQQRHGRHDLPWQASRDPYRIWLSEVMLQQTQVATVLPYYQRFLDRFPTVHALAAAGEDQVLALWSGLGYYARARNLHRAAREVDASGRAFPSTYEELVRLPGIGRSTAAAIAAFASGERRAILDGNVRRVLARHAGVEGDASRTATAARLWEVAESRLPERGIESYTQGMMDLGASICSARAPACLACPVAHDCVARIEGRIDSLPTPRKRAERPRRRIGMLVVLSRGEALLEKRPSPGIWGGLWSLPEAPVSSAPAEALEENWGLVAAKVEPLESFEHAFTHFTLEVVPWRIRLASPARTTSRPGMWLALSDIEGAALPAPVRKLLRSVAAGEGSGGGSRLASSRR
jgi:A/G-specific adenine glycosylase